MSEKNTLSRREFDEVIRRATELSMGDPDAGLNETGLFRIAEEVGLPQAHVRRALAELRDKQRSRREGGSFFDGALIQASRTVPGDARDIGKALDDFLVKRSLLRPLRSGPVLRTYKPANDTVSELKRAFTQKKNCVITAKAVEARFDQLSDSTAHVRLAVDYSARRSGYLALAWTAVLGGVGGLGAGGVALAVAFGFPMLAGGGLGVLAGTAAGWASVIGVRALWREQRNEIREEVEGILDKLEAGEPLQPPPPKWRRWIQDQLGSSVG